ncbi:MAG TPA: acetylxylan esterase [Opitutus sp.]|nr:acetylxylan esterase [Opitutus sp.]
MGLTFAAVVALGGSSDAGAAEVTTFPLPDPLVRFDGTAITTAQQWTESRRPELFAAFEREVYGITPDRKIEMQARVREEGLAFEGKVRRQQVVLTFRSEFGTGTAELLIYSPAKSSAPLPVFLGLNFLGNASVARDPAILGRGERGASERRWPIEYITGAGYAVATLCYEDFFPDNDEASYATSLQRLFPPEERGPGADRWGAIATWAWGLSRALDYFETDPQFDAKHVAVIGHSRLGKAALWAGARDPRFALVLSNDSGCGGAALSKRIAGETVADINDRFPHWFCHNFRRYNRREADLPIDQHELLALMAPRALGVHSASEDAWADPEGERRALELAQPVYALFDVAPLDAPESDPRPRRLHYFLRTGVHDLLLPDWVEYVRFADETLKRIRR